LSSAYSGHPQDLFGKNFGGVEFDRRISQKLG
jgi:hypothetical protein